MQTTSAALTNLYNQANTIKALPKVLCEWNHNRFAPSITVSHNGAPYRTEATTVTFSDTVVPSPAYVPYPVESVIKPNRPYSGLPKARVGNAKARGPKSTNHFRTTGPTTNYQYWESSATSAAGGAIDSNASLISVVYGNLRSTNKIVVGLETSNSYPTNYYIEVTSNGGTSWTTVGTNVALNSKGQAILYWSGSSWGTTYNDTSSTSINGIRVFPTALNVGGAHFAVIEISGRLLKDISSDVISASVSKSMQSYDVASPTGTNSANTCNVVLDNTTATYDPENAAGPYYGLIDTNAKIILGYLIDTSAYGGSASEYMAQGEFYVDSWQPDSGDTQVTVAGTDFAKFLQTQPVQERLFQSYTVPAIVAEILRGAGFNNFSIDTVNDEAEFVVPYVWYSKEDTVWSAISELCATTQSAVFIDETGTLVYLPRNTLYNKITPTYTLSGINSGNVLANVENISEQFNVQANKLIISYTAAHANQKTVRTNKADTQLDDAAYFEEYVNQIYSTEYDLTNSRPISSVLWKPSQSSVVLNSAFLARPMTSTDTTMYIDAEKASTWPWKSKINVEGEIISTDSKVYKWYKNGAAQYSDVHDIAEQYKFDIQADTYSRGQNRYTGQINGIKRGQLNSLAASYGVDISSWGHALNGSVGSAYVRQDASTMILSGPAGTYEDYLYSLRGAAGDSYVSYGTRMRFARVSGQAFTAGLRWNCQGNTRAGYYLEINTTHMAVDVLKGTVGEIRVYKMDANGGKTSLGDNLLKGEVYGADELISIGNYWVDLDVRKDAGRFYIYVKGRLVCSFIDNTYTSGGWGVFVRGNTTAVFEYFYVNNDLNSPAVDKSSIRDGITGGYASGYAAVEILRNAKGQLQWFLDDFGAYCHEIREFAIRFDKFPAVLALPYVSNYWRSGVIASNMTPFGGTLLVANTSRSVAILTGEDPGIYPGQSINQIIAVYGQLVISDNEKTLVIENKIASRKHGEITYELNNRWIQTESQAREVGQFMVDHLGNPCDVITAQGFFNPSIQIGDLVNINWPSRNMNSSTHRYHVLSVETGFSQGINTSLTLRRAR